MRKFSILIDAGFIKRKLGSQDEPMTADVLDDFIRNLTGHEALKDLVLYRIYFYDAPPLTETKTKPLNGGKVNFGDTELAKANKRLHTELCKKPFYAMRYGELAFRGWSINPRIFKNGGDSIQITAENLIPNIQQKGVDMRIGLDIASLTLKKQVDIIVLITGDSDFIPAMKFARKEGVQLYLVRLSHSVIPELYEHSDLDLITQN